MEMIDVLTKLQEIAETKPELVKDAVENVSKTNPKEVSENAVESETPIKENPLMALGKVAAKSAGAAAGTTAVNRVADKVFGKEDKIQEYKVGSFKDFLASKGIDIYKLKQQEYSKYAQDYKMAKDQSADAEFAKQGTADQKTYTPSTSDTPAKVEGGMSDIHIGAQEVVGEYVDDDGNLVQPKADVLKTMAADAKRSPFPRSYEIETAMQMVADKFDDNGQAKDDYEPDPEANVPHDVDTQMNMDAPKELNTSIMATEDKKPINEDIKMTADSPEEASMLMQMLKLAGVQQVTPDMINAEPEAEANPEHGDEGHDHSDCPVCGDDAVGSGDMAKMRDMVTAPDEEKAEETFANEPEEKVSDVDTLVNVHSGGLNKQKQQVRKEYPGDNPLASKYETVEDKISEEDLSNSLRAQYEGFKKEYNEAAKVAETKAKPDFLDMDKDGNKKEPMKKAISDKK